ncbi:hypothetical protein [Larkinella ripae]
MAPNTTIVRPSERSAPVLLFAVTQQIKAVGGSVWLIHTAEFATVVRAEIGKINIRLVIARPGESVDNILDERNSHTVQSIDGLRDWLRKLINK